MGWRMSKKKGKRLNGNIMVKIAERIRVCCC